MQKAEVNEDSLLTLSHTCVQGKSELTYCCLNTIQNQFLYAVGEEGMFGGYR